MVSQTSYKKMAIPSLFAVLGVFALGLSSAPVSAALAPTLGAPAPVASTAGAPEKAIKVAGSTKKKKKKRKRKRRGSYYN